MCPTLPQALLFLHSLSVPHSEGQPKPGEADPPPFNSHVHVPPNFSAFETVDQAVDQAAGEGLELLGVSNYYDYSVYEPFSRLARRSGMFPVFGTEIICVNESLQQDQIKVNDPGNPGKMYVCGKGITRFDPLTERGQQLLDRIRQNDSDRMRTMISKLGQVFGQGGCAVDLDENAVREMIVCRHRCSAQQVIIQERHVAMAFQQELFNQFGENERGEVLETVLGVPYEGDPRDAVAVQNQIRSNLMKMGKPAFVPEAPISFDQARELVVELGGVPTYPVLADGTSPVCAFETPVDDWLQNLTDYGFQAAEFIPSRNSPQVLREYVTAVREAGFVVTAGTEHNTLAEKPLTLECEGSEPVPDEVSRVLWEGACVIAAHQFLSANGETGYVDARGERNPDYAGENGIRALSSLGERVVRGTAQQ